MTDVGEEQSGAEQLDEATASAAADASQQAGSQTEWPEETLAAFAAISDGEPDQPGQESGDATKAGEESGSDAKPDAQPASQRLTKAQKAAAKELGLSDKDLGALGESATVILDRHSQRVQKLAGEKGAEKQRAQRYAEALAKYAQDADAPDADGETSAPQIGEDLTEDDLLDGSAGAHKLNEKFKGIASTVRDIVRGELQSVLGRKKTETTVQDEADSFFGGLDAELYPELAGDDADPDAQADLIEQAAEYIRDRKSSGRSVPLAGALKRVLPNPAPDKLADKIVRNFAKKAATYNAGATRDPARRNASDPPDPERAGWDALRKHRVWQPD